MAQFLKFLLYLLLGSPLLATPAENLSSLLDPAKIATLKGERPINTRLYKVLYWVEKYNILRRYPRPALMDKRLADAKVFWIALCLCVVLIFVPFVCVAGVFSVCCFGVFCVVFVVETSPADY